jgi:HlyD family secretion protein
MESAMNKKLLVGAAGAAILAVGTVAVFARGASASATGDYAFETAKVERGDVARIVSASGAVQPLTKVDVGSEVSGKITEIMVDFNSPVARNQVLAQIDPQTFITAVNSARASLLQAEASVATSRSAVERAIVNLDVAEKAFNRQQALFAEQAISQSAWELADQQYKYAKLDLDNNRSALKSAEAGLVRARATLEESELRLERTKILSPIDGIVITREVEVGQTVQSSQQVAKFFTIAQDLSQIQIEASVVESDIGGIDDGDPAVFTVDAFPGQRFQGQVVQVRKQGVEAANVVTYTVVISARNPNGVLLPGMTANVEITADRAEDVLRIAYDATRFQPPKDLAEKLNAAEGAAGGQSGGGSAGPQMAGMGGGGRGPGGGQGRGPGGFGGGPGAMNELLTEMGIDSARVEKISAEMRAEMERNRAAMAPAQASGSPLGAGGFGPPQSIVQQQQMQEMRQKMQAAQEAIMRRNLSPEEFADYASRRAEMQSQKRAPVYVLDAAGELKRETLTIGISDGSFAEIIRGAEEGDAFVVRATSTKAAKKP